MDALANVIKTTEKRIEEVQQLHIAALEAGNQYLADLWLNEKNRLCDNVKKSLQLLAVPSGNLTRGSDAGVDWSRALVTPADIQAIILDYKCGNLRLPTVHGIPDFRGRPSLLYFQLDSSQFSSSSALAEVVHKAMASSESRVIIAGPSGCGKTRTVLSYLIDKRGLYFTTSSELNGGSEDVRELLSQVGGRDCLQQYEVNMRLLELFTLLLLASRLVIHKFCKELEMTAYQWVLFQATCGGLVSSRESQIGGYDVFHNLYKQLCGLVSEQVRDAASLTHLSFTLREELQRRFGDFPVIAVDEAQILVKHKAQGYFRSRDGSTDMPISSGFFRCIAELTCSPVLICGTGNTLQFSRDLLVSSQKFVPPLPFFGVFPGWSSADEMISYAEWTIRLSPADEELIRQSIWKKFKGRYRPFASIIETMLLERCSLRDAADIVGAAYTTKGGLDRIMVKAGLHKSYYDTIWRLVQEKPPSGLNLVNVLQRAVLSFFTRGRGVVIRMKAELTVEALEHGIGTLVMRKNFQHDAVEFEEPLLLKAAGQVFQDFYDDRRLRNMCLEVIGGDPDGAGRGMKFQYGIPFMFQNRWEEYDGRMCDMPLFHKVYADRRTPKPFKRLMEKKGVYVEGDSWVHRYTNTYKTKEFLLERDREERRCTTLLCEPSQGVDTVSRVRFPGSSDADVDVLAQYKFCQDPLFPAAYEDAIQKADYRHELQGAAKWRICLVWIYPQRRPYGKGYWWSKKSLVMVVDAETAHYILNEEDLKILCGIKHNAAVLEH